MARTRHSALARARDKKLREAAEVLRSLGFTGRQNNKIAGHTLLALLGLKPLHHWHTAAEPLRGITPIIDFVAEMYGVRYAPNTRETIRDEAVKYFVEAGLLIRNPDDPNRPTNSGKTVYQMEPNALGLFRAYGTSGWAAKFKSYLEARDRGFLGLIPTPHRRLPESEIIA